MIRIRTKINDSNRVFTIFNDGKWITLISGQDSITSSSLLEAGQNHLQAAQVLRKKVCNE